MYRSLARVCAAGLVLLCFAVTPAVAQSVVVTGTVVDSTGAPLEGASVVALMPADSALVAYGVTRGDGLFRLRRVPAGTYLLNVSYVGFAPLSREITVGGEALDLGKITMEGATEELDALIVTAERIPIRINKDTLEYSARAFAVAPNANVEELLKRLPGVEVDRDGNIKAQGEDVRKVLVDGKEFFGDDPKIATKNLPADAVEKVQVYDKQSDMAEFTGVDDGNEEKTINLELKEDRKSGYFGNVSGGVGGMSADMTDGARYQGRASVNRFSPTTQFSLLGNLNNVNEQGFAMGDYIQFMGGMQAMMSGGSMRLGGGGIPLGINISDGYSTTWSGGVNFNREFGKLDLRSSYFGNRVRNTQERELVQQQLAGASTAAIASQNGTQLSTNLNHRINTRLEYEFSKGHDLRLRASGSFTTADLVNDSFRETRDADGELENTSLNDYASDNRSLMGNAALTYRKRFEGGRSLVAEVSTDVNDSELEGDLEALNAFYRDGNVLTREELSQLQAQASDNLTHAEKLTFTQPLGNRRFLQLDAEYREVREDRDRTVFDVSGGTPVRDDALSSAFDRTYRYASAGANLSQKGEKLSINAGVEVQQSDLTGEVRGLGDPIEQSYLRVLPKVTFDYAFSQSKNMQISYSASTREPSLQELQPVPDNSDPLNVYVGNPDLRPEYAHRLMLRYMLFDAFSFTNFFAYVSATYATDKIATARTIDDNFRQTRTPVNTDGDWSVMGHASFGTPIRPLGLKIGINFQPMFDRNIEFVNGAENTTNIFRNTVSLRLENRNKDTFDAVVGARYTFNDVSYSLNEELSQSYVNRSFFTELAWTPTASWRIATELDYKLYADEGFGEGRSVPLWKAEISRGFVNDRVRVRLVALDLLDQNVGVSYTNTAAYVQQERTNALGRYVMLGITYNLSRAGQGGPGIHSVRIGG